MALSTAARVYRMSAAGNPWRDFPIPFTTPLSPEHKRYSTTAHHFYERVKPQMMKGQYAPVFMAVGMITMSVGFGLFTVAHQLKRAPNVQVSKSKRKILPEIETPEEVAENSDKFMKYSLFRNVAHVQDVDRQEVMSDPIRGDADTKGWHMETLKDVDVLPSHPAHA